MVMKSKSPFKHLAFPRRLPGDVPRTLCGGGATNGLAEAEGAAGPGFAGTVAMIRLEMMVV